jgi:hypothetical protein
MWRYGGAELSKRANRVEDDDDDDDDGAAAVCVRGSLSLFDVIF